MPDLSLEVEPTGLDEGLTEQENTEESVWEYAASVFKEVKCRTVEACFNLLRWKCDLLITDFHKTEVGASSGVRGTACLSVLEQTL